MRIHFLQHVAFETPGLIGEWAGQRGHALTGTRLDLGEPLPALDSFDLLLVMGGPMSVNDEDVHAWLRPEKQLIADAMAAGKFVIGICLGSQMLAGVLGSAIYRNKEKEIGWFPVHTTGAGSLFEGMPSEFTVFHWHGDTYDIPKGAVHLATTAGCRSQAFETERCLGLQFHLEMTEGIIKDLLVQCAADLGAGAYQQPADGIRLEMWRLAQTRTLLFALLDRVSSRVFVVA
ncbi:type 1 glutamine amidotransferase [Paludibaculum fermentans]|uniref:Amidotransferase n=1 Tax=Paludibaculum fermentans TaxID=1473598 RepID=A0A7S7SKL1_PALFE|nr:type 1 glutamine amidotransferase [Paludibaculum fermentans]QOY88449.1 amidotransferase [Paludibaculum fermentans]